MLAGWRLALSVGLAGVRAAGRRGHQGGGGVRLEGVGRAGDRAGGPLLIGQAGQIGQAVTVGGAVLPGADRGGGGVIRAGHVQKKSQGGRRRPFTLAFSFLLLIEAGAGPSRCRSGPGPSGTGSGCT